MPLDQDYEFDETATMSFGDHLEELRKRVILALVFPIPLMFIYWPLSDNILAIIIRPLSRALWRKGLDDRLQVLSPPEALLTQIKIAILAALITAGPWILWQAWLFIKPGLYKVERRFVYFLVPGSAIMTLLGVAMLYFAMLPLILIVLVGFGTNLDKSLTLKEWQARAGVQVNVDDLPSLPILDGPPVNARIGTAWLSPEHELIVVVPEKRGARPPADTEPDAEAANDPNANETNKIELGYRRIPLLKSSSISQEFRLTTYVNFVLALTLGMVIAFQTPLVLVLLGWLNLASVEWLEKNRKYALLVTAVLGAVLTPADPWSMLAMWIPLYLLFELGVLLMKLLPAKTVAEGSFLGRHSHPPSEIADPAEHSDVTETDPEPPSKRSDDSADKHGDGTGQ